MSVKYFGKYRGLVTDNRDPEQMGRIRGRVPDVLGEADTPWAMPCVTLPLSNDVGSGLPEIGSNVWIEFEQGDPKYPIWWAATLPVQPKRHVHCGTPHE